MPVCIWSLSAHIALISCGYAVYSERQRRFPLTDDQRRLSLLVKFWGYCQEVSIEEWPVAIMILATKFGWRLSSRIFHDTGFIQLPFTLFHIRTFIVLFFTFRDANFHFAPGVLPVQGERHNGVAFPVHAAIERV